MILFPHDLIEMAFLIDDRIRDKIHLSNVLIALVLLSLSLFLLFVISSLNLSFENEGYSPFIIWSPYQIVPLFLVGMVFLSMLIGFETQKRSFNVKKLPLIFPIMFLSLLIIFVWEPRQITDHISILEILYVFAFPSLFFLGILLGIFMTLLWSLEERTLNRKTLEVCFFNAVLVILIFPIGGILIFASLIELFFGHNSFFPVYPYFGEGTFGSVLVVSVIISMYSSARILKYVETFSNVTIIHLFSQNIKKIWMIFLEIIAGFFCIAASFSLMGGIITDFTPLPLSIPFDFVLLSIILTIPFSLLISRDEIFALVKNDSKVEEDQ